MEGSALVAQYLDSIDVSFGGLRVCCEAQYEAGTRLNLDIFFQRAAPVTITAEVVWVEPVRAGNAARFDVGLSFVDLNADALKFLMSVLDSEVEWQGSSEARAESAMPPASGDAFDLEEPVSEVHPVTPAPGCESPQRDAPLRPCAPPPPRDENDRPTVRPSSDVQAPAQAQPPAPQTPARRPLRQPGPEWPSMASALLGAIDASSGQRRSHRIGDDPIAEMRDLFSSGDYAGALAIADRILTAQPDHPLARALRADCCAALEDVYAFRLGATDRVPVVVRPPAPADSPSFDHRTGFLLSLVDGSSPLEAIVDACGMPKADALRILVDLVQRGVIGFR